MTKVNNSDHVIISTNPLSAGWLVYRPFGSLVKYIIIMVQIDIALWVEHLYY